MGLIPLAISLASEFLPNLVGLIVGDKAESVATDIVNAAKAITSQNEPDAIQSSLRADPAAVERLQQSFIDYQKSKDIEDTKRLGDVNETIREEIRSEHAFVRNARPAFTYTMAFSWLVQMTAMTYAVIRTPEHAGAIITAFAGLSFMWTVGLSVVGVYSWRRTDEKIGGTTGGLQSLLDKIPGRGR